ncbi:MAG TPA: DUF2142 domain-containing protein [Candidatus Merdenecus merdavium]|nr:DUF2142 domain-containing protein [Candidatus Merdenecus merdavium]
MLQNKKMWHKLLIMFVFIIATGLLGELFFNLPMLIGRVDKQLSFDLETIETNGFRHSDEGLFAEAPPNAEEMPELNKDPSYDPLELESEQQIILPIKKQYVGKLKYKFESNANVTALVQINLADGAAKKIRDLNNISYKESVVNVRNTTDEIIIAFSGISDAFTITDVTIDNTFTFSMIRFMFVCLIAFLVCFLCFFRSLIAKKIEVGFFVLGITMGGMMLLALPQQKVGWDEEIHFLRAFSLADRMFGHEDIQVSPAVDRLFSNSLENWVNHMPQSKEEQMEGMHYLNANGLYRREDINAREDIKVTREYNLVQHTGVGYLPQVITLCIAMLFHLPFGLVFLIGRVGNLLMYVFVLYFAIKKIPIGKRILAGISLLPTPLFLTVVYAYDPMVYAFTALGLAYIIEIMVNKKSKITWRTILVICISMILGSLPKAIYIPLIILGVFIPKDRFTDKKHMYIFKFSMIFVFLLLMASFIVPSTGGNVDGDSRVGGTSVSGQMVSIFSNPIRYTKVLLKSIKDTFLPYTVGIDATGTYAYLGTLSSLYLPCIYIVFLTLTDTVKDKKLDWRYKGIMGVLIFGVICLIWTALYLSFTPVGANYILGVQGRYYLPLLPFMCIIFNTTKIENKISPNIYNHIVLAGAGFITILSMYSALIIQWF